MKNTLKEELDRIYSLTYGKEILEQQSFVNKVNTNPQLQRIDDPKKADLLSGDINEIYQLLTNVAASGGLSQSSKGKGWQKYIEALQLALTILGYQLPTYGIDGSFGQETASAINKFIGANFPQSPQNGVANRDVINRILYFLKKQGVTNSDIQNYIDPINPNMAQNYQKKVSIFTTLDLSNINGLKQYANICQKFIDSRPPNPLNITGVMLASGAKNAFDRYGRVVPPELALSQLVIEGGIGNANVNSRPIRTKNPYNVGNWDNEKSSYYNNVQDAINNYFLLIAANYLGDDKNPDDLARNFVNASDDRYASDPNYEQKIQSLSRQINKLVQTELSAS